MVSVPPVRVPAPPVTPYRFGLFSVADMPTETSVHTRNGVEYEPLTSTPAKTTHDFQQRLPLPADKHVPKGVPYVSATPFTVFHGFNCMPVGFSQAEIEDRARQALALGEQYAVENTYMLGTEGNTPKLVDAAVTSVLNGGTVVDPVLAIALLEKAIHGVYGGEGVIHAPRSVLPGLFARHMVEKEGSRLVTRLGTRIAAGAGYDLGNVSPAGAAPSAGAAWMYATGPVGIWRSEPFLNPDTIAAALNRGTNQLEVLVERTYVVSHEAGCWAVLVDLPGGVAA